MTQVEIPKELMRPLVFGDEAQIVALEQYRVKRLEYEGDGTMAEWEVTLELSASTIVKVSAMNKPEAERIARDKYTGVLEYEAEIDAYAEKRAST